MCKKDVKLYIYYLNHDINRTIYPCIVFYCILRAGEYDRMKAIWSFFGAESAVPI